MAQVLYSAKDRQGKPVSGFAQAESVRQAREQLLNAGMTEIVLHADPAVGGIDANTLEGLSPAQMRELARLSIAALRKPGLQQVLRDVVLMNRWWLLVDAGFFVWGWVIASPWLMATGIVLAIFPFVLALWNYRHGGRYNALLRAFAVGDRARIRELTEKLRPMSARVEQMGLDLDMRLAWIAAREGRLQEALASVEHWREPLMAKPGLFEQRVAMLYYAAGDRQGCVRLMEEAHAAAPDEPSRALDLALVHARFGDPVRARAVLDRIDTSLLPSYAAGFVGWTSGMILLRQQQPGALDQMSQGLTAFLALAANPAVWTSLAACTCDHAVALLQAGRKEQAREQLAKVWPIVKAHADPALMRMLQADGLAPN